MIVSSVAFSGVLAVLCHLCRLPVAVWVVLFVAFPSSMGIAGTILFWRTDIDIDGAIDSHQRELRSLARQRKPAENRAVDAELKFDEIQTKYENIVAAFKSSINRLRLTPWETLQGKPFEDFLENVFIEWGCDVETTPTSGDHGVDLVVSKHGRRTAIQAKGWVGSVGNEVVLKLCGGMKFYECDECAVITTSKFTSRAQEAATKLGCRLVDGEQIPRLIEGELELVGL
jgi:restriction system protein